MPDALPVQPEESTDPMKGNGRDTDAEQPAVHHPSAAGPTGQNETSKGLSRASAISSVAIGLGCIALAIYQATHRGSDVAFLMIAGLVAVILPHFIGSIRELLSRVVSLKYGSTEVILRSEVEEREKKLRQFVERGLLNAAAQIDEVAEGVAPDAEVSKKSAGKSREAQDGVAPTKAQLKREFRAKYKTGGESNDPLAGRGNADKAKLDEYGISWRIEAHGKYDYEVTISSKPKEEQLEGTEVYLLLHPTVNPRIMDGVIRNRVIEFPEIEVWAGFTCLMYFAKTREYIEFDLTNPRYRRRFRGDDDEWSRFRDTD